MCCPSALVTAQEDGPAKTEERTGQMPTDLRVQQNLRKLRRQIENREPSAAETLRRLSTAEPRLLVPADQENHFIPLHLALTHASARLSEGLQRDLESAVGPAAHLGLTELIRNENWTGIPDFVQRFPGTRAAAQACLLTAQLQQQRGHHYAARYWLDAAGTALPIHDMQMPARNLSNSLPDSAPTRSPLENQSSTDDAGSDWQVRWHDRENVGTPLQNGLQTAQLMHFEQPVSGWNALSDQRRVLRRTLRGLTALDPRTGEAQWAYRLKPNHLDFLRSTSGGIDLSALLDLEPWEQSSAQFFLDFPVVGRIHADSQNIYAVLIDPPRSSQRIRRQGPPEVSARLVAVSRNTGRRVWTTGSPPLHRSDDSTLTSCWLTGPPTATQGYLHCLIEKKGEIRLATLRAATGELLDSTLLAFPKESIARDIVRQRIASAPINVGGLILCPTTTGWLVAVDRLTRSVVWATRTTSPTKRQPAWRGFGAFDLNGIYAGQTRSTSTILKHLSDSVAVLPWRSQDIAVIEIHSGIRTHHWQTKPSATVVAETNDSLLLYTAETNKLSSFRVSSGKATWDIPLEEYHGTPCGRGTVIGGHFLLPTTSGSILEVDPTSGTVLRDHAQLIPEAQTGILLPLPSDDRSSTTDLLFVGIIDTICLTRDKIDPGVDIVGRVERMLRNDRLGDAWKLLHNIDPDAPNAKELKQRRFDVALGLAQRSQLPDSEDLTVLAQNEPQQFLAQAMQIRQLADDDPIEAAQKALQLAHGAATHRLQIPGSLSAGQPLSADATSQVLLSPATWAVQFLHHALATQTDASLKLAEDLESIPNEWLLQLHHPAAAPVVLERAASSASVEMRLHLIMHLADINHKSSNTPSDDLQEIVRSLRQQIKDTAVTATAYDARRAANDRLMSAVLNESIKAFTGEDPTTPPISGFRDETPLSIVPFSHTQSSNSRPKLIRAAQPEDRVMRHLEFQVTGAPGRLTIHDRVSQELLLSITGRISELSESGTREFEVLRSGSLVLLPGFSSLSVVSLLEQRLLWHREDQTGLANYPQRLLYQAVQATETATEQMQEAFEIESPLPVRPVGMTDRWACLRNSGSIEVVDLLTGFTKWEHRLSPGGTALATSSCVLLTSGDEHEGAIVALNPHDGSPLPCAVDFSDLNTTFHISGPEIIRLVVDEQNVTLEWKNPLTGEITRRIALTNVATVQKLNTLSAIAVVENSGRLARIDLNSGASSEWDWIETDPKQSSAKWNPQQIAVYEDTDFLYLFQPADVRLYVDRYVTPYSAVRVLDRNTGELLWEKEVPDLVSAVAITDQFTLPFLPTLQQTVNPESGQLHEWMRLQCHHKRTGKLLINAQLPSRYAYDDMTIRVDRRNHVVASIHGTQVRFEPEGDASVRTPVSSEQ